MTNYDMDELRRQGKVPDLEKRREFAKDIIESEKDNIQYTHEQMITREKKSRGIRSENEWPKSVEIGKDETPHTAVDIEISDDDFRRVAFQAHERDITFNKMVNLILKDGLRSSEHIFEHPPKPQLLNEDKWYNLKLFVGRTF